MWITYKNIVLVNMDNLRTLTFKTQKWSSGKEFFSIVDGSDSPVFWFDTSQDRDIAWKKLCTLLDAKEL